MKTLNEPSQVASRIRKGTKTEMKRMVSGMESHHGKSQDMTKLSPLFCIVALLGATSVSYRAGRTYKQTHAIKSQFHNDGNSTLFEGPDFLHQRRTKFTVASKTCEVDECRATQQVLLEEVFFKEPFGQYQEEDVEEDDTNEVSDPTGVHLIMDLERVEVGFLQSMDRIREAMYETIWEASLKHDFAIISVHCQKSVLDITCVAILKDGHHMTVLTNVNDATCSMDIYFADDDNLLDVAPILEKYFGVGDKPLMRFRQILRGSRTFSQRWNVLEMDVTEMLHEFKNHFYYKKEIGSTVSGFQEISVWEGLQKDRQSLDGYERTLDAGENNYYTQNPQLFHPNRLLFMDGVIQSSTIGDEAYHEALVHPAMFAHENPPKRVAIIGGGEGATLREILKHKSVEVCTMIEIDPGIVQASRDWLPSMNDCYDFGTGNCFDEERTDLRCEDAFGWFLKRFKKDGIVPDELKTDPFDVIIMDILDPEDTVEFAVKLYQDTHFWGTLFTALSNNGIMVIQLGQSPEHQHYGEQFGKFKNRYNLFKTVETVGFQSIFIYHDTHSDFEHPWSYLVACKSEACAKEWNRSEAETNLRMHQRILPSKSSAPTLKYFDGATMEQYRKPVKEWEAVYCAQIPVPIECSLYQSIYHAYAWSEAFEFLPGKGSPKLKVKTNIPKGSMIYHDEEFPHFNTHFTSAEPFTAFQNEGYQKPACGVISPLMESNMLGRISPLRDRHQNLQILTRDVVVGEELIC